MPKATKTKATKTKAPPANPDEEDFAFGSEPLLGDDASSQPPPAKKKKKKVWRKKEAKPGEEAKEGRDSFLQLLGSEDPLQGRSVREFHPEKEEGEDASAWTASLVEFLRSQLPKWSEWVLREKDSAPCGAPRLLIITASALRAVELSRAVAPFKLPGCKTAKLFSKHMKRAEQGKFLKQKRIQLGLGTPARIAELTEDGALDLGRLRAVAVDWAWRDAKQRRLPDMPDLAAAAKALFVRQLLPNAPPKMEILLL